MAQREPAMPAAGDGAIDHVAFRLAADADAVRRRLREHGWAYREARVPHTGERQFFVAIPFGARVELVCDAAPLQGATFNPSSL